MYSILNNILGAPHLLNASRWYFPKMFWSIYIYIHTYSICALYLPSIPWNLLYTAMYLLLSTLRCVDSYVVFLYRLSILSHLCWLCRNLFFKQKKPSHSQNPSELMRCPDLHTLGSNIATIRFWKSLPTLFHGGLCFWTKFKTMEVKSPCILQYCVYIALSTALSSWGEGNNCINTNYYYYHCPGLLNLKILSLKVDIILVEWLSSPFCLGRVGIWFMESTPLCHSRHCSEHSMSVPTIGILAELVHQPPVHPFQDACLVVVPHSPAKLFIIHPVVALPLTPQLRQSFRLHHPEDALLLVLPVQGAMIVFGWQEKVTDEFPQVRIV